MAETCGTCKHAITVDPIGHWRTWGGVDWTGTHIHCPWYSKSQGRQPLSTVAVISKGSKCVMDPSRWEANGRD